MPTRRITQTMLFLALVSSSYWAAAGSCSLSAKVVKPIKGISLGMSAELLQSSSVGFEKTPWPNGTTRYHETDFSNGTMVDAYVAGERVAQISLRFEDYYPKDIEELASSLHRQYGLPASGWKLPAGDTKKNSAYVGEVRCADFTVLYSTGRDDAKGKLDPAIFILEQRK